MTLVINWSPSWDQNASNNGCSQELGRPSVIPCDLHIHLIKCKVIGCSRPCCPINHDWVMCWRLQCGPERISRGVNAKQATLWLNRGISSSEKKPAVPSRSNCDHGPSLFDHTARAFLLFLRHFKKLNTRSKINWNLLSEFYSNLANQLDCKHFSSEVLHAHLANLLSKVFSVGLEIL